MGEKVLQLILRRDNTYYICSLVAFIHVNYWAKIANKMGFVVQTSGYTNFTARQRQSETYSWKALVKLGN